MMSISDSVDGFNRFLRQLKQDMSQLVTRRIEHQLEVEVERWLHRASHQRRKQVDRRQTRARCGRCGSCQAQDFCRNGHRKRQIVTTYGVLTFWLPRVVCNCGGSVAVPFSLLQPYQRWWQDVLEQIGQWAQWGLSLRQMQAAVGQQSQTQVGLRKLNEVVQHVEQPLGIELTSVPPIIMLDAIWITLVHPQGSIRSDRLGRQRISKKRDKVAVLIALGLYPQSQRWGILDWEIAPAEDQTAWERLLVRLENRGVYRERAVELFIHDGGKGLTAALNRLHPHVPHQRCIFHKLRNLWQAIQVPDDLSRTQAKAFKRRMMHQVAAVYRAETLNEAIVLRDAFCQDYHPTQPDLVATLLRDWSDTVAFYRVLPRFPQWKTTALRTTSLLERVNRMVRRLARAAGAYHSTSGLLATLARVLSPLRLT